MRRQSRVKVKVRGVTIGGSAPLVCLPLLAGTGAELAARAAELVALGPDLLEWRVDAMADVDAGQVATLLRTLRQAIGDLPLLFTCRIAAEGGRGGMAGAERLALLLAALDSGEIDLVDVELCNGPEFIAPVAAKARAVGCALILSHHDFQATPSADSILATLCAAEAAGADIAKVAVMPQSSGDVLSLLTACDRARQGAVGIPLIAISMGSLGVVSRVAGPLFGSDITFAAGAEASAPGQLPITALRLAMATVLGA